MADPMTDVEAAKAFTKENQHRPLFASLYPGPSPTINFHSPNKGKPRCQGSVGHGVHGGQCDKIGKIITADGSTWCGTHSPEGVEKRVAKREAHYQAYRAKADAGYAADRRNAAMIAGFPAMRDALREIANGHNDPRSLALEVLGDMLTNDLP